MTTAVAPAEKRGRDWAEIVATILLAVATVATAWSGYQASRWNGEQAKAQARANAARVEGSSAADLANSQTQVDVATFMQWIDAQAAEDTELAAFYRKRFRAEFVPAFDAWLAAKPFTNEDAPLTPFTLPEYQLEARKQATELNATADAAAAEARVDIQRATNYVLGVVLFAGALFFAGISTKLVGGHARWAILGLGCVLFLGTLVWIATSPISVSV